jgi:hypothetical protein
VSDKNSRSFWQSSHDGIEHDPPIETIRALAEMGEQIRREWEASQKELEPPD